MKKYNYKLINLKNIENKNINDVLDYLTYCGSKKFDDNDAIGLLSLAEYINENNKYGFVISYLITRINKEFDVLKIGNNVVINVEIKTNKRKDDINQIRHNYKILLSQYSDYNVIIYSYVSSKNILLKYDLENDCLIDSSFIDLNSNLSNIADYEIPNIDYKLDNVYQKPDFFLNKNYFLSDSQEEAKKRILKSDKKIIAIHGYGGTGKTLLSLDLYTLIASDKKIFLVPFAIEQIIDSKLVCSIGIYTLRYVIASIKDKDIIFVDEAQRVTYNNLKSLNEKCSKLYLFFDENQDIDNVGGIKEFLHNNSKDVLDIHLDQAIRNDPTIDRYAKKICGMEKSKVKIKLFDSSKIEILMLDEFLRIKDNYSDYVYIEPSKSKFWNFSCKKDCNRKFCEKFKQTFKSNIVHFELGKDYENVVIYLCGGYYINGKKIDQKLQMCYGNISKQLYTIMVRAANKLLFVCDDIRIYNFLVKCKNDLDV